MSHQMTVSLIDYFQQNVLELKIEINKLNAKTLTSWNTQNKTRNNKTL